ncbi:MAG: zinc ribbon domain-containing protein [Eubacteriales bacterium]|nr:zinc ribbon domain-containing protein [Eubacteriales bacterium]
MKCNNCGKPIPNGSESCPYCGTTQNAVLEDFEEPRYCPFAVASFIVSLVGTLLFAVICGPVSMILAGIAFYNFDRFADKASPKLKGKGFMIAGFLLGIFEFVIGAAALAANNSTAVFIFWMH